MDGARIANAAVACACDIADLTGRAGVDIFSFGGTKNAALGVEALVLGERVSGRMRDHIRYLRKQNLQLFSKQRFASAQMTALYEGDLWRECAAQANAMAQALYEGACEAGIEFLLPVCGNELFALLPAKQVAPLQERFRFYLWNKDEKPGFDSVRWVCSWDTTAEDVAELVAALQALGLNSETGARA
jgi:threonine aldolase